MRKGDLDLHLFARGDATMESLSIPEDAPDHCVIFRINREGKLAADQEMRKIGQKRQIGPVVQQI